MNEILVLAEHRDGELRDVTFEMLGKAGALAGSSGGAVTALLLGTGVGDMAGKLTDYADEVLVVDHGNLTNFNSAVYQPVVADVVKSRAPSLVMIGNTAFGVDLAPSLAVALEFPLASDCIDVTLDGGAVSVTRQIYEGKIDERVSFRDAATALVTVRAAAFPFEDGTRSGSVFELDTAVPEEPAIRRFLEYVEAAAGDVDITKSGEFVVVNERAFQTDHTAVVWPWVENITFRTNKGDAGCDEFLTDGVNRGVGYLRE